MLEFLTFLKNVLSTLCFLILVKSIVCSIIKKGKG